MADSTADASGDGSAEVESELDRDIGIVGAVALGVGTMIAAETARAIAHSEDADVRVVHVVSPDADGSERRDAENRVAETAEVLAGVSVGQELLEGEDVVGTIVAESANHELTVIGATRESAVEQPIFGVIGATHESAVEQLIFGAILEKVGAGSRHGHHDQAQPRHHVAAAPPLR